MDITVVFRQMAIMLLMLCVGVASARAGVVDMETNRRLSRFAMAVPQSATIIASAMNMDAGMSVGKVLGVLGVGCVMYAVLTALGLAVPRLARIRKEDRNVYSFLTIFGNVGFMGFPLVGALFGNTAVFYAALLCVIFNLLCFTLGVGLISGGRDGRFTWRKLLTAPLISSAAAVAIIFLPIRWPEPVREAVTQIGNMILPLSMIIVGASLGEQKLRDVFLDWRLYLFAPVRLLLAPVVLWAVMGLFVRDGLLLNVVTVLGGTPAAAVCAMLSIQYGANEKLATRTVFLTTVLSLGTIPLVCWLLL